MSANFSDTVMLVALRIRAPRWQRKDKKITAEVHEQHNAAPDAGRYNKALLTKEALAGIVAADGALRTFHAAQTLPWSNDGMRILPTLNHPEYSAGLRKLQDLRARAVADFVAEYPRHVRDAEFRLNGMFDAADYPSPGDVAGLYSVKVETLPFPTARDFRAELAQGDVERIRAEIEQRTAEVQAAALRDLWDRLYRAIDHMAERLAVPHGDTGGGFKDSLVGNLRDLCDLLPRLNVTGDARLDAFRRCALERLAALDPQTLRDSASTRAEAARVAGLLAGKMAGYCGPATGPSTGSGGASGHGTAPAQEVA